MTKKNKIIIFFLIISIIKTAQADFWEQLTVISKKMVDFTAQKTLDLTVKNLPEGVTADYEKFNANILENFFILYNVTIKIDKPNLKNHTTIGKIEVRKVDVLKALSGEQTTFGQALLSDLAIEDLRIINQAAVLWNLKAEKVVMYNFIPADQSNEQVFSAEKTILTNFKAEQKTGMDFSSLQLGEQYQINELMITELKIKTNHLQSSEELWNLIDFDYALIDNQKIDDRFKLFNLIKTR